MVAVDTNIIVRLLTQDDELQYQKSLAIFQNQNSQAALVMTQKKT